MTFTFKSIDTSDIPLLYAWLQQPHVAQWWDNAHIDQATFTKKFLSDMTRAGYQQYIAYYNNVPIGYVQSYKAAQAGPGWWPNEPAGTFGIDLYIGDPEYLNKGLGTLLIKAFVQKLFNDSQVLRIIIDPHPDNKQAIRSFEKADFKQVGLVKTPDGTRLLMEILKRAHA